MRSKDLQNSAAEYTMNTTTLGPINSKENEVKQKTLSFKKRELENANGTDHDKSRKLIGKMKSLETNKNGDHNSLQKLQISTPISSASWKGSSELHRAAIKLQKVYKSYRTRRNLADCAVVVEELWWKELDSAALTRSSVSFFDSNKSETAISRWERARIRAAKVGKGLSKDEKAKKLDLRHWLEAIDPRHRYGHNLHMYYDVWFARETTQTFFYWLDIGDGKEVNLEDCPRTDLQHQCIKYLGPKEREAYEVVVENGKLVYRKTRVYVETPEGSKWIFVLSSSRNFYVGEKKKGLFQHSSFLAGAATICSGRLVARNGTLEAIWPFSGHYRPTEESFNEFCSFLEDHQVDLTNVKQCPIDDDIPPKVVSNKKQPMAMILDSYNAESMKANGQAKNTTAAALIEEEEEEEVKQDLNNNKSRSNINSEAAFEFGKKPLLLSLQQKWSTGTGARISCVRDYPTQLQFHALEQVKLSPRIKDPSPPPPSQASGPLSSPRPTPKIPLSPRLARMLRI